MKEHATAAGNEHGPANETPRKITRFRKGSTYRLHLYGGAFADYRLSDFFKVDGQKAAIFTTRPQELGLVFGCALADAENLEDIQFADALKANIYDGDEAETALFIVYAKDGTVIGPLAISAKDRISSRQQ